MCACGKGGEQLVAGRFRFRSQTLTLTLTLSPALAPTRAFRSAVDSLLVISLCESLRVQKRFAEQQSLSTI